MFGLPYDFTFRNCLSSVVIIGSAKTIANFLAGMHLAAKGETVGEARRMNKRQNPLWKRRSMSYSNLRNFLGPYPFYRILWPFHSVIQTDCTFPEDTKQTKKDN